MAKKNAYALFVEEEHERRKRSDPRAKIGRLYGEMSKKWQEMPTEGKDYYKQKVKLPAGVHLPRPACLKTDQDDDDFDIDNIELPDLPQASSESHQKPASDEYCASTVATIAPQPTTNKPSAVPDHSNSRKEAQETYEDTEFLRIHNTCRNLINAKTVKQVVDDDMFAFSVNVLCDHTIRENGKRIDLYCPLEISIVSYAMCKGALKDPFHALIDCGPVPSGKLGDATEHWENHKIPFPPRDPDYDETSRNDYKNIYKDMLEYVGSERVILIWSTDYYEQTRGSLEWLYRKATEDGSDLPKVSSWTILPIAEYVSAIDDHISCHLSKSQPAHFSIYYVEKKLEEDEASTYCDAFKCHFHIIEENDVRWCAMARAYRMFNTLAPGFDWIVNLFTTYCEEQRQIEQNNKAIQDSQADQEPRRFRELKPEQQFFPAGVARKLKPNEIASAGFVLEIEPDIH